MASDGRDVDLRFVQGAQVGDGGVQINYFASSPLGGISPNDRAQSIGASAAVRAAASRLRVPPCPAFLPRKEVQEQVLYRLAAEPAPCKAPVLALVGMGGSGKTLLAQAVACDEQAVARFDDGVIWIRAGDRSPEECQAALLRALGEPASPGRVETGIELLRERMSGTRCLLVIDDVISNEQRLALDVLGAGSAILFTTRNHEPVPRGRAYLMEALSRDESRALLAVHAGAELPANSREVIEEVIVRCGGLPLALAICAAMTGPDCSWADVVTLLRKPNPASLQATFDDDYRHTSLLAAIEASVEGLDDVARRRYEDLAVFAGHGPVPVSAAARLWRPACDAAESLHQVRQLARRSLLTYRGDDSTFILHDLLYDYVQYRARGRLRELHGQFAAAYLKRWGAPEAGFPGLDRRQPLDADTRYGIVNVPRHMVKAGRDGMLHELLAVELEGSKPGNAWFAVHDETGLETEYLADLDLARSCAEQSADAAVTADARARNIALEVRYSLIRSLLAAMARTVPSRALAALVRKDAWPFGRAQTYAEMIPYPFDRVNALLALARLPSVSQAQLVSLIGHAKATVPRLQQPIDRIYALAYLAELSPGKRDRDQLFGQALEMVEKTYRRRVGEFPRDGQYREVRALLLANMAKDWNKARDLRELAAGELLEGARRSPRFDHSYQDALTEAMPRLKGLPNSEELRDEVLAIARRRSQSGYPWNVEALATRLQYAADDEKSSVIEEMLALHDRLGQHEEDSEPQWARQRDREYLACTLAPFLSPGDLSNLVESTLEHASGGGTIRVLTAALAYLPGVGQPGAREKAADAVRKGAEISDKAMAEMAALMRVLPGPLRVELIRETFDRVHNENPSQAALLLCELANARIVLPESLMGKAASSRLTRDALGQLAPHLPPGLLRIAVTRHRHLPDAPKGWARALTGLAPALPDTYLPVILDLIRGVGTPEEQVTFRDASDIEERITLLASLAERLPPELISTAAQAVPASTSIGTFDEKLRTSELLAMLASRAPDDLRQPLFERASEAACTTQLYEPSFQVLINDAKDAGQLLDALRLVSALCSSAKNLPPTPRHPHDKALAVRVLGITREISNPCSRTHYLAKLASWVPEPQRPAVLREAAQAALLPHPCNDGPCRSLHGLDEAIRLVPGPDRLPLAVQTTGALTPDEECDDCMRQLICLVAYYPGPDGAEFQQRAIQCLAAITSPGDKTVSLGLHSALKVLAPCLSPDGTLASAKTVITTHLPAEIVPQIIRALSEFLTEPEPDALDYNPDHAREPGDLRSGLSIWRDRMKHAAAEGQAPFLAFIAEAWLSIPADSSVTERNFTGRHIAEELLRIRNSWCTT